jgi:hypothetical protein
MPSFTTVPTRATGDPVINTDWNTYIKDNESFLYGPPMCRAYTNIAVTVNNGVSTAIDFNAERFDPYSMHSTVSNPQQIFASSGAGVYLVNAVVIWEASATGNRGVGLKVNGTTDIANQTNPAPTTAGYMTVTTAWKFALDDYVELMCYQDSGGSLDVTTAELSVVWLGSGA